MRQQPRKAPRPALSASRAVKALDFLAGHAGEGHTLSEIARGLGASTSSVHAVLGVLESDGYVTRDPTDKTYRLGFGAIAVGHAALQQHPVVQRARERTSELAGRLRLECLTGAIVGEEVVIVAEAGTPERLQLRPRVGQRLPNSPALTALAAAYADEEEVEAWLDRLGPGVGKAVRDSYRKAAVAVRARGYEIGLETETRRTIGLALAALNLEPQSRRLKHKLREAVDELGREEAKLLDPDPKLAHPVNNIQAPIFDIHSRCMAGITLVGFDHPLPMREIDHYARALLEVAEDVTRSAGGRAAG